MGNLCSPKSFTFWVSNGYSKTILIRFGDEQNDYTKLDYGKGAAFNISNRIDDMLVHIVKKHGRKTLFDGFYCPGSNYIITLKGEFVRTINRKIWIDADGKDHQPPSQEIIEDRMKFTAER